MEKIYFDNAATTRPSQEVLRELDKIANNLYANPSSLHDFGMETELRIKEASKVMANIINCDYNEIIYTSGGTESNNLAILGTANYINNKNVITTTTEHPSVLECYKELEKRGCQVIYIPVDSNGIIDFECLEQSINKDTVLVSVLHINNETGVIQDIEAIGNMIKQKNTKTLYHVDAVQSFCKHKMDVRKSRIDLLSMSSHKIHGLKGTGALFVKTSVNIKPMIFGGGQQKNIRPGTENTFGIMTFSKAAELAFENMKKNYEKISFISNFISSSLEELKEITINSPDDSSMYILNLSCRGIKSEVLVHALSEQNIFVSAGSACSSKVKTNSVLMSYGKTNDIIDSSIRLSFSHYNNTDEAKRFVDIYKKTIATLIKV